MKRLIFRSEALPFWLLLAAILGLFLLERSPFEVWQKIRHYLLSAPFFYQSLFLYLLALVLALLTYRNLYNVKILLASFLFLMMGIFSMLCFIFNVPAVVTVCIGGTDDRQ